jgi:hypothetical protein
VLAVRHVDELRVVTAQDAGDPGRRDVRADDGVPPPGGLLEGGQVPGGLGVEFDVYWLSRMRWNAE